MDILTDDYGFKYVEKVPDDFRLATLDDFHVNRKKNIGMVFLVKWFTVANYYEYNQVTERLTAEKLLPFIEQKRVFVKS